MGGATAEEILEGPVLQTSGDSLAGFYRRDQENDDGTEAYEWGKLTSGSRTSALWWILFPFTLINVAGWMFRPTAGELQTDHEDRGSPLWLGRLLIVIGGLAITAVYVSWTVALTVEMVTFGCSTDAACRERWYMAPLNMFGPDNQVWLTTVGIGLAAVIVLGLFLFILRTQDRLEGYETDPARRKLDTMTSQQTSRLRRNTQLENQAFWYKWAEHRSLFRGHLIWVMALLGAGAGHTLKTVGWTPPAGNAWLGILAVVAVVLTMLWALTAPEKYRETASFGERTTLVFSSRVKWMIGHVTAASSVGWLAWALTGWLNDTTTPEFGFLAVVRSLTMVLLVGAAAMLILLLLRRTRTGMSTSLPAALLPGLAAALAIIITGAGFASVANLLGRFLLGSSWVANNGFDNSIVDLLLLSLLVTGLWAAWRIWRADKPIADITQHYFDSTSPDDLSDRDRAWIKSVASARVLAATPRQADQFLALLASTLVILNLIQGATGGFQIAAGPDDAYAAPLFHVEGLRFFHTAAATATVLYLFPGIQLIRQMSKSRDSRRQLGKMWDVFSFWPRRFHPLAAPCYAERAVPEFRNRIRQHLADGKRVVVSAHSQGTVIAFAALVQIAAENEEVEVVSPDRAGEMSYTEFDAKVQSETTDSDAAFPTVAPGAATLDRAGLITFGSPLSALYGRFFPWHFGTPGRFQQLRNRMADLPEIGRAWRNLYRRTDYIGQEVFVAPGGELDPPDAGADMFVPAASQPLFPIDSHSNYEKTTELRATVTSFRNHIGEV